VPEKKTKPVRKVRALLDLTFRKDPAVAGDYYTIPAGTVFEPAAHHNVALMVASGKLEEVGDG